MGNTCCTNQKNENEQIQINAKSAQNGFQEMEISMKDIMGNHSRNGKYKSGKQLNNESFQCAQTLEEWEERRKEYLIRQEEMKYPGMKFSKEELQANEKFIELRDDFINNEMPKDFYTQCQKYFDSFDNYKLFQIIKLMPKTSVLHIHSDVCCKPNWLKMILRQYPDNIYQNQSNKFIYYFDNEPVEDGEYILVQVLKEASSNQEKWEQKFIESFLVMPSDSQLDQSVLWDKFILSLVSLFGLILHEKIYEIYMLDLLNDCREEGLQHICIRLISESIKNDKKEGIPDEEVVKIIERCASKVREKCPNFTYSLVYMGVKNLDFTIEPNLECAFKIAKMFPKIAVGYDLVGNEDDFLTQYQLKETLINKYQELQKKYGSHVDYVFHAGESHDHKNNNILDSLILGTKRIGHGFLLFKQQYLMDEVIKRGIVVEVNMLSNLILKYHADLRSHPAIMMHNAGVKISLSSDDPGTFRISKVCHDLFVAVSVFPLDVKDLKRIMLNGIDGMILNEKEKNKHLKLFLKRWSKFIGALLK